MTREKYKRKSSSKSSKFLHKLFFFLDKIYKVLRVIDLIMKIFQ